MKRIIQGMAFATAMTLASSAFAASAMVTTDLNLRTGPGTNYGRIAAMPGGAIVDVRGCTRGYSWCRVYWNGYEGWAASSYLARQTGGGSFDNYAASVGVPIIAGAIIGGVIANGYNDNNRYYYRHHRRYYRHDNPRYYRHDNPRYYRHDHPSYYRHDRRTEFGNLNRSGGRRWRHSVQDGH